MITATAVQHTHPLTRLMARHGLTAAAYLKRVADRHRALGFGAMAHRKEKATRWTREGVTPERTALLAIAASTASTSLTSTATAGRASCCSPSMTTRPFLSRRGRWRVRSHH
ncbi:hypothetical protein ACF07V_36755 [Streptomyces sp. NPDC015661]|uniref:hypothetical protein n=1 Tax=Streptomyces sp. NPDC015661 TaxID=3364961 RepID=UPI0036F6E9A5